MCGRYSATKSPATLAVEFEATDGTGVEAPSADYNVAPTKPVVAVVQRHPRDEQGVADQSRTVRSLRVMRWGLVPHWAKNRAMGATMINARADTAATKPAFRSSLAKRRCLLPADGWFEWRRAGKAKQPFFMTRRDGASLAFAGLWSTWHDPAAAVADPPLITCAVLTTDAVGPLADIHDRMPLLLPADEWANWLDPDRPDVAGLLSTPDDSVAESLELRPVSDAVNNVRNNGPELVAPAAETVDLDELSLFDPPRITSP
ncbi:MAG TPA: SOS response-associated peptidase [Pseudonocardiaceae bacterium]|nr:SOS response-associated peptidase [Pseudonocardiaceae bacterium]